MPVPKISDHMRFTVTRAVSGFAGLTVHSAKRQRSRSSRGRARKKVRYAGRTRSVRAPKLRASARRRTPSRRFFADQMIAIFRKAVQFPGSAPAIAPSERAVVVTLRKIIFAYRVHSSSDHSAIGFAQLPRRSPRTATRAASSAEASAHKNENPESPTAATGCVRVHSPEFSGALVLMLSYPDPVYAAYQVRSALPPIIGASLPSSCRTSSRIIPSSTDSTEAMTGPRNNPRKPKAWTPPRIENTKTSGCS